MRNINRLFTLLMGLSIMLFFSCDVEPIGSETPINTTNPENGNGAGNTPDGDYYPTTVGNYWEASVTESNLLNNINSEIVGTATFNGLEYYKFNDLTYGVGIAEVVEYSYLRKNNGDYIGRLDEAVIELVGGFTTTISGMEYTILKDYLEEGDTWSDDFSFDITTSGLPPATLVVDYVGTILEKDVTVNVNDVVYEDVIKVRLVFSEENGDLPGMFSDSEAWYAKNIGVVKSVTIDATGETISDYVLTNYYVQ